MAHWVDVSGNRFGEQQSFITGSVMKKTEIEAFITKYGKYKKHFSDPNYWEKLKKSGTDIGKKGVAHALVLYYGLQDANMPGWSKAVIVCALGYLILPTDLIPDFVPGLGFTDDVGVLVAAFKNIEDSIPESSKSKTRKKLKELF
jgi:uncharacterized membrane protein YkvA (DUF1232 family)